MSDVALADPEPSAGARVNFLEGELDPSGVITLQRRVESAHGRVVVDLGAVRGASASTLRILCSALRRVNRRVQLAVTGADRDLRRVLEVFATEGAFHATIGASSAKPRRPRPWRPSSRRSVSRAAPTAGSSARPTCPPPPSRIPPRPALFRRPPQREPANPHEGAMTRTPPIPSIVAFCGVDPPTGRRP